MRHCLHNALVCRRSADVDEGVRNPNLNPIGQCQELPGARCWAAHGGAGSYTRGTGRWNWTGVPRPCLCLPKALVHGQGIQWQVWHVLRQCRWHRSEHADRVRLLGTPIIDESVFHLKTHTLRCLLPEDVQSAFCTEPVALACKFWMLVHQLL